MSINPIDSSSTNGSLNVYLAEVQEKEEPVTMAKAQVMAATTMNPLALPSADGLYVIGGVALKASVFGIGTTRGFSTWGF